MKKFLIIFTSIVLILGYVHSGFSSRPEPIDLVKETIDRILKLLEDETLSLPEMRAEQKKQILSVVGARFDFREMSKRSMARHWKMRTPEDQDYFIELFSKLLLDRYICRVESNSESEILYKRQIIKNNKAVVYTVALKNNTEIPLAYKLLKSENGWMVYDVVIEGVSLIRNYRTQFTSVIKREKYAGLIKKMEEKVAKGEDAN
ncbi:MAG: ABC transporter substrate-binding protein [Thermodesulfobacteriota bacterium]|nr:ABC transporter substrate-binding protein [Thermodesulfobacteriota bacterium]